jgi:outer membrane lipoprotein-sorting protein
MIPVLLRKTVIPPSSYINFIDSIEQTLERGRSVPPLQEEKMTLTGAIRVLLLIVPFFLTGSALPDNPSVRIQPDVRGLIEKMGSAYAEVEDYRTRVHIETRSTEGRSHTETFLYTFKKPDRIRIDFESPHPGLVLVYPDKNGKVVVRPLQWAHFFKLHLDPNSSFLQTPSGQPIDRTDLGLLIKNIGHSLTDQRRGPVSIREEGDLIQVSVLAEDHFRKGVLTLYRFLIDRTLWLPTGVRESTQDGVLERDISFRNLRINIHLPSHFFQLDGE